MSTEVLGGLAGLALFIFGMRMLVWGQAPGMIVRSFRSVRDAGYYHLLFGLALLIYVGGLHLPGTVAAQAAGLLAVVLVGVAVVRFRPRGRGPTRKA
ncbi:hypothetical protein ACWT_0640 [Actinoplanes sp. SE50]|uniref:hypothetical protein n=1 Tax=unclassified Actinoplanes TaxID=2626549 RepID=UPI00023ED192|nr:MULTISPECIES: hypothetical protein [unclassified Actinoplanes]AEV81654.1 hypothetical protein ACPL_757 [Actinoplanes sp. SE50/110]ATO80055.1 hypothetical protein ACWT_0640 [Actinoplanes sp. SE50]SLL97459.1 hypothetical protein ACSP50_0663 [Actinoplanes sp. SE50/110]